MMHRAGSKFAAKWDDFSRVREVYSNGAYKIVDIEGVRVGLINGRFLKQYYP